MSERKLASIQKISKITPIKDADKIELATIMGWNCVVKKGEFKEGDFGVYFEIDSYLPVENRYSFLKKIRKHPLLGEGFRIKTMRMRGELSQGLILPIETFPEIIKSELIEGTDLTEKLKVKKWEEIEKNGSVGALRGSFHPVISKTDEPRIQSSLRLLEAIYKKPYYISEKIDGTSITIVKEDGELNAYSRNNKFVFETSAIKEWMDSKGITEVLMNYDGNIAIQGEFYGEGIQSNPLRIKGKDFRFFNLRDPKTNQRYDYKDWNKILEAIGLTDKLLSVKIEEEGDSFEYTLEELLEKAKGKYTPYIPREGIVIRTQTDGISFKVINNDYLEKWEK